MVGVKYQLIILMTCMALCVGVCSAAEPPVVDFTSDVRIGVAPLTVQFADISSGMESSPPQVLATDVAAGYFISLALLENGTVVGWGQDGTGAIVIPDGLSATAISVGSVGHHSLALKTDGTVVGWGGNTYGQATPPDGLTDVIAIAAGGYHSLALLENGTVVGWGNNWYEQIDIPPGLTNVVAIAAGENHSLAILSDGTIVGWGNNGFNQINIPIGLSDVTAIAAGKDHSLALKSDGTVVGWGYAGYGQNAIPDGLVATAIATGGCHSLAIATNGTVVGWGDDGCGQITIPDGLVATMIAAGDSHSLVVTSTGAVNGWGDDWRGQLPVPDALASISGASSPPTWTWNFGDGGSSTIQNPRHTYSIFGTYTVSVIVTNSYGNDSEIKTDYIVVHNETDYYPTGSMNFGVWLPFTDYYLGEFITLDESNGKVTINSVGMIGTCINWLLAHTAQFGVLIASLAVVTIVTLKTQSIFALFLSLSLILSNMYAPWCPEEAKLMLWVILAIALIGIILKPIIRKI